MEDRISLFNAVWISDGVRAVRIPDGGFTNWLQSTNVSAVLGEFYVASNSGYKIINTAHRESANSPYYERSLKYELLYKYCWQLPVSMYNLALIIR